MAHGLTSRHAIKQVDRLLSNPGIDITAVLHHWGGYVVGSRTGINVAIDWTNFDADGHATILLSLLTRHGRSAPLVWLTVPAATLKRQQTKYECQVLLDLAEALGYDRLFKSNSLKHRQHSLFNQGCLLHDLIPDMPQHRLPPLLERFGLMIKKMPMLKAAFSIV